MAGRRGVTLPRRDYSLLSPAQLRLIKQRAEPPPPPDDSERTRKLEGHARLQTIVGGWTNTIASNRYDRQTRMQRQAEAEEQRRCEIDAEEAKIQTLKRESQLAAARQAEFQRRPEVIAVNSQLLLDEVMLEREEQLAAKRRRQIRDMKLQMDFDAAYKAEHDRRLELELEHLRARRAKAEETAAGFRAQREERITQRELEKSAQRVADSAIGEALAINAEAERARAEQSRMRTRALATQNATQNEALLALRSRNAELEAIEDARRRDLQTKLMDEEDERRAEVERKRLERTKQREVLMERAAAQLVTTQQGQQDFLQKQLDEQYAKESAAILAGAERKRKLAEERRRDFLEVSRAREAREARGRVVEVEPPVEEDDPVVSPERRRLGEIELRKFQLRQAAEKRERDAAVKERERLEFQAKLDEDAADLEATRQYALRVLSENT